MSGEIIRLGDKTSHGGIVLEGAIADICMGKPIAFVGHKVYCPLCKGAFSIIEGAPTVTFYGIGVALAGMHTACGATLIASQFTDFVEYGGGANPAKAARSDSALFAPASAPTTARRFDDKFILVDAETGESDGSRNTALDWRH
jgi:uncharacterized Zn-binding protein involved in type VI secretion